MPSPETGAHWDPSRVENGGMLRTLGRLLVLLGVCALVSSGLVLETSWPAHAGTAGELSVRVLPAGGWAFSWTPVPGALSYTLERDVSLFAGDHGKPDETSVALGAEATSATLPDGPWHTGARWDERFVLTAQTADGPVVLANDNSCPDAFYLAARGSGQNVEPAYAGGLGDRSAHVFNAMKSFLHVGASSIRPLPVLGTYPAVKGYDVPQMQQSANAGTKEARGLIDQIRLNCKDTPVVMFGYSQGGWVIGDTLTKTIASASSKDYANSEVVKVLLMADARYAGKLPGVGYYPYDHGGAGVALARGPFGAASGIVNNYCFPYDFVCNNTATHFHSAFYSCFEQRAAADGARALAARLAWSPDIPSLVNCDVRPLNGRIAQYQGTWYSIRTNAISANKALTVSPLAGAATKRCLLARRVRSADPQTFTAAMASNESAVGRAVACVDPTEIRSRAVVPSDSIRSNGYWVDSRLVIKKIPDSLSATCYDEKSGPRGTLHGITSLELSSVGGLAGTMPACLGPRASAGRILRLKSSEPSSSITYLVDTRGVRHHIPDSRTLACLVGWDNRQSVEGLGWDHVKSLPESKTPATCDPPTRLEGSIVRTPAGRAFLVDAALRKHWIATSYTWQCLVDRGVAVVHVTSGQADGIATGSTQPDCISPAPVEGRIIRRSDDVSWVVVNGQRHHLPSLAADVCARAVDGRSVALSGLSYDAAASIPESSPYDCSIEGTVLQVQDGTQPYPSYRISGGKRFWIPDGWTFNYWTTRLPVLAAHGESTVKELPDGGRDTPRIDAATFPRQVLVKTIGSPTAYFIDGSGVKHWIPTGGDYLCLNRWRNLRLAATLAPSQIAAFTSGSSQTCSTKSAYNHVLRVAATGASYLVDGTGVRHWIPNGGTYLCLTAWRGYPVIDNLAQSQADAFTAGDSQQCAPREAYGHVIRVGSTGTSYLVDTAGTRHWIPNGGVYLCLLYWKNSPLIDNATQQQVDAFPDGSDASCVATEAFNRILRVGPTGASYLVLNDGVAHWIPNGGTFLCLKYWQGYALLDNLTAFQVQALPTGPDATCTASQAFNTIVRNGSTGVAYLVDGSGYRHWIPSGGTFDCLYYWKHVPLYNDLEQGYIDALPDAGSNASCDPTEAFNTIVRNGTTGAAYLVDGSGIRHWIPNGGTFDCLYYWKQIPLYNDLEQGYIDALPSGGDASCVVSEAFNTVLRETTTGSAYFVDAGGTRHWIQDGATYNCLIKHYSYYHDLTWDYINAIPEGPWQPRSSC